MGCAAAIGAILLVFVGFMDSKASSLPEDTPDKTIRKFALTAKLGLIPLLSQIVVIFGTYLWLFYPENSVLFYFWSVGFPVALLLFILYSIVGTLLL
jgi:hypothetical protein